MCCVWLCGEYQSSETKVILICFVCSLYNILYICIFSLIHDRVGIFVQYCVLVLDQSVITYYLTLLGPIIGKESTILSCIFLSVSLYNI